jgi:hypothetical protein
VHADADYDADSDADECEVDECEAVALRQWHPVKSMLQDLHRISNCMMHNKFAQIVTSQGKSQS